MNTMLIDKYVSAATRDRIHALAMYQAECHFFCNVGEGEYPENAIDALSGMDGGAPASDALEIGIVVWDPFWDSTIAELLERIENFTEAQENALLQAVSMQLEDEEYRRSVGTLIKETNTLDFYRKVKKKAAKSAK